MKRLLAAMPAAWRHTRERGPDARAVAARFGEFDILTGPSHVTPGRKPVPDDILRPEYARAPPAPVVDRMHEVRLNHWLLVA